MPPAKCTAGRASSCERPRGASCAVIARDPDYLRWVLRSAGACSALSLALLGLGAEPAHARATLFTPLTGAADPLAGDGVEGLFSAPALGDLDGDGDLDLVAGEREGTFAYFENTGSALAGGFAARSGAQNPLDAENVGLFSTPALGDLDGDGDIDVVTGPAITPKFENAIVLPASQLLPEPGRGALLGAGIALVSWLARLRARCRTDQRATAKLAS